MAHLQIVPVEKSQHFPRCSALTGAVAYNAFTTTPVFAAIGGPVHEILVTPGETVRAGQPLLTVNSPDYSAARSAYIKARKPLHSPKKSTIARKISSPTEPSPKPTSSKPNPTAPRRRRTCNPAKMLCAPSGVNDPGTRREESCQDDFANSRARSGGRRNRRAPGGPGPAAASRRNASASPFPT